MNYSPLGEYQTPVRQVSLTGELPLLIVWPWGKSLNIGASVSSSVILASSHPSRDRLWNVNEMCSIVCGLRSA